MSPEDVARQPPYLPDIPTAVLVRPMAAFPAGLGLDAREYKRKALNEAYANRNFRFLTALARDLIAAHTVEAVLTRVMEIAFQALPVGRGFIMLKGHAGELTCEILRRRDRVVHRPDGEAPVSKTILETVMEKRVALLTEDAQRDDRLTTQHSIRVHHIRAAMCAPLWSGDKIMGFMQVDSPSGAGSFSELDLDFLIALANFAAVAVEGIRARQVHERLQRYHSPAVIEAVMQDEASAEQVHRFKKATVTVLFADLVGFAALSEAAEPEQVADLLNGYCTRSVEAIFSEGGTLDKFIGDCVMAFFGAPIELSDHSMRAVRAAVRIQDAMDRWNIQRRQDGLVEVQCRIGLNSGAVVVGDVGSDLRADYTVLGNTVNVAARLEESVAGPGEIVLSDATRRLLGGEVELESLGEFALRGLGHKIASYRLVRRS